MTTGTSTFEEVKEIIKEFVINEIWEGQDRGFDKIKGSDSLSGHPDIGELGLFRLMEHLADMHTFDVSDEELDTQDDIAQYITLQIEEQE